MICKKCGCRVSDTAAFCEKCGAPMAEFGMTEEKQAVLPPKDPKKTMTAVLAVIIAALIALLCVKFVPTLFRSTESYMAEGDYAKAYEKAQSDVERDMIRAENVAAVESAYTVENLKDPTSFVLRDAYFWQNDDGGYVLVLLVNAANSYGAQVSNYWLYKRPVDASEWSFYNAFSDLDQEESQSWDSEKEIYEKLIDNRNKRVVQSAMLMGSPVSKDGIKRINDMFENGTLDDVQLLDVYDDAA